MPPIIEDFWPRVLGTIMWFFSTIAWPCLVIGALVWGVCWVVSLILLAIG